MTPEEKLKLAGAFEPSARTAKELYVHFLTFTRPAMLEDKKAIGILFGMLTNLQECVEEGLPAMKFYAQIGRDLGASFNEGPRAEMLNKLSVLRREGWN